MRERVGKGQGPRQRRAEDGEAGAVNALQPMTPASPAFCLPTTFSPPSLITMNITTIINWTFSAGSKRKGRKNRSKSKWRQQATERATHRLPLATLEGGPTCVISPLSRLARRRMWFAPLFLSLLSICLSVCHSSFCHSIPSATAVAVASGGSTLPRAVWMWCAT